MIRNNLAWIKTLAFGALLLAGACALAQGPIRKVGSLDTGTAYRVFVQGDYAYVAHNEGVSVIDIRQRDKPRQTALIELREAAFDVVAEGDLVYIAAPVDGLVIADTGDKAAAVVAGVFAVGGINQVCVYERMVYAGTSAGELLLVDAQDPGAPRQVGRLTGLGGTSLMAACLENVVYLSGSETGLQVIDVSEPDRPVKVRTVGGTQGAKDAHIAGDLMYLACHGNGVRILDISEPLEPKTMASFNDGGEAWGAGAGGGLLWVGDLQEGIELHDVSDPSAPVLVADAPGYAPHDLFFDGEYAYLADQDRGFVILRYAGE